MQQAALFSPADWHITAISMKAQPPLPTPHLAGPSIPRRKEIDPKFTPITDGRPPLFPLRILASPWRNNEVDP